MHELGFEPRKLTHRLLRPTPLTARVFMQKSARGGVRTLGLGLIRPTLYQLSYTSIDFFNRFSPILRSGFDPLTSGHDIGPTLSLTELTEC